MGGQKKNRDREKEVERKRDKRTEGKTYRENVG